MKKLIVSIFFVIGLVGCDSEKNSNKEISLKESKIENKVQELISQMTLDEKIAEMMQDAPANERL